jgi:GTPase SAR1 family protein
MLIGEPGSGKTTLINSLTAKWTEIDRQINPVKHINYSTPYGPALQLGWTREPFGGTDTLGQTAITAVSTWYQQGIDGLVIAEGDRLANDRFVKLALDSGELILLYLDTDPDLARQRRIDRMRLYNLQSQNLYWLKGRQTKHRNLANKWQAIPIPGDLPTEAQVSLIESYLSPTTG